MEHPYKWLVKYFVLGAIPATVYVCIELLYRGYSDISMWVLSFFLCLLIGELNEYIPWDTPLTLQMFLGAIIVTVGELVAGLILNVWLGLNIWDYSNVPLNFMGQICAPFSVIWYFLSAVAIVVDDYLRYWLFDEEKPRYRLFEGL